MRAKRSDVGVYMIQQRCVSKSKALLATYRNCAAAGRQPEFNGGRVPSSGLVAVFALKNLCKSLTAFGFGSHRLAKYQYYKLHGTQRRWAACGASLRTCPRIAYAAANCLWRALVSALGWRFELGDWRIRTRYELI